MALLISDANIFIDFEEGGVLDELFGLPDTIGVPDLLFESDLRARHVGLLDLGLKLMELQADAVERAVVLAATYRRPRRLDLAALALAEQEQCPLLTGDRNLRVAAEREGVVVRGTLWICRRLVVEGVVTVAELDRAYGRMKSAGRRLPWGEVQLQLQRFRGR